MDCIPPGSFVQGISQTRILESVAISFSKVSSQSRDGTWISCISGGFFTVWTSREALKYRVCIWNIWNSSAQETCFSSPFYSFIHTHIHVYTQACIYVSIWTHGYSFYTWGYNPTQLHCVAQIVTALAIGSLSVVLNSPWFLDRVLKWI